MPAEPLKKKQLSVAALHINILGRMNWDSEMVKAFQVCAWEQERRGVTANCQYAWISQASWF